jgi:glycosyltransferase involved in cell wall biosynthesis
MPLPASKKITLPIVLNIGVVGARKRQLELLRVARRIHERGFRFQMRFIGYCGGGAYGVEFLEAVRKAEEEGYASYLGQLDEADLRVEMDAATGLCHFPSEEAFGLVVAEGLARNLKFFGAKTGGIPEIVEGIEGAELFDPEDFTALQLRLEAWIGQGGGIVSGQEIVAKRYHPSVIATKHLEIYDEILSGSLSCG